MYCKSFEFAKLIFRIESEIQLIDSAATRPFQVQSFVWDYKISVVLTDEPITDFEGYGSLNRRGEVFHLLLNRYKYQTISILDVLSFIPVQDLLFEQDMFILHASFIEVNGEAILFSGNSGIGKSTQAGLWEQLAGASIINGDRALLFKQGDCWFASGWYQSGTSGICKKRICPIKALIFLEQGTDNAVYCLSGLDRFKRIISQSSYQTADRNHMEWITALASALASNAAVYQYICRKDESAVNALRDYLYGNYEKSTLARG